VVFSDPTVATEIMTGSWDRRACTSRLPYPRMESQRRLTSTPVPVGYIKTIWNGTATGHRCRDHDLRRDHGFYTITLTGVTVPDNATMLTGGLATLTVCPPPAAHPDQPAGLPLRRCHCRQGLHCRPEVRRSDSADSRRLAGAATGAPGGKAYTAGA